MSACQTAVCLSASLLLATGVQDQGNFHNGINPAKGMPLLD